MILETTLCGIRLQNPVLAASGTFGYGMEFARQVDLDQLGGRGAVEGHEGGDAGVILENFFVGTFPSFRHEVTGLLLESAEPGKLLILSVSIRWAAFRSLR